MNSDYATTSCISVVSDLAPLMYVAFYGLHRTCNLYDRILSNTPIIEKDHSKKGNDYYQTIVRYISKMEAQCTTDSLM